MENQMDQETMRAFIEGLDGAAVLDQAGAYTYVSPSWERYTGISAEDALGKKVWELVPDTHATEVYRTKKPVFARVVRSQVVPAFTSYFPIWRRTARSWVCSSISYSRGWTPHRISPGRSTPCPAR